MGKRSERYPLLRICKRLAIICYQLMKLFPVQEKIVLISRLNKTTSFDFKLLEKEIKRQKPGVKVVILNHRMRSYVKHMLDVLVEMYHIATAKGVIVDSYVIPVSVLHHREDLKVIQIWHALGAIKQFGKMTVDKKAGHNKNLADLMRMHNGYTYVTTGSPEMAPVFSKCFGVKQSQIRPLGMPRVDYLLSKKSKAQAEKNLAALFPAKSRSKSKKKTILYAPTFRKKEKIMPNDLLLKIDFSKYNLVIKQHTLDKTDLTSAKLKSQQALKIQEIIKDNMESIKVIKDELGVLELLPAVDYVITDYSAIAFEAAVIEKPLFFWDYDVAKYQKNCGLAINYEKEMPGKIYQNAADIMKSIERDNFSIAKLKKFAKKYVAVQDGTATKQIVRLLWH